MKFFNPSVFRGRFFSGNSVSLQQFWDRFFFDPITPDLIFQPFRVVGDTVTGFSAGALTVDVDYDILTSNSDREVTLFEPGAWDDRTSGTTVLGTLHVPDDFILPDASPGNTPNNPTILANKTTNTATYLNGVARPDAGGPIWGYKSNDFKASHAGSGTAGGAVSLAELNSTINHALAINVWGQKYLNNTENGFVAPALKADDGFDDPENSNYYGGNLSNIKMGSRVAIPASISAESLGISSQHGLALYNALVKYGAYIVDNTAWDALGINAYADAEAALFAIPDEEMAPLFQAMQLVLGSVFSPSSVSSLKLWLKASAGISKDGSNLISNWANQASTGSAYDASQSTSGSKPLFVSSSINGLPVVRFDGTDDFLSFTGTALNIARSKPGFTLSVITQAADVGAIQDIFFASDGTSGTGRIEVGKVDTGESAVGGIRSDGEGFQAITSLAAVGTGPVLTTGVWDFTNNTLSLYVNGVLQGTSTSVWGSAGNSSDTPSIDMYLGKFTGGQFLNGDIPEIVVCDEALSNDTRAKLDTYLLEEYNVA